MNLFENDARTSRRLQTLINSTYK